MDESSSFLYLDYYMTAWTIINLTRHLSICICQVELNLLQLRRWNHRFLEKFTPTASTTLDFLSRNSKFQLILHWIWSSFQCISVVPVLGMGHLMGVDARIYVLRSYHLQEQSGRLQGGDVILLCFRYNASGAKNVRHQERYQEEDQVICH